MKGIGKVEELITKVAADTFITRDTQMSAFLPARGCSWKTEYSSVLIEDKCNFLQLKVENAVKKRCLSASTSSL